MKSVRLPLFCKIRKEKGNGMSLWLSEKKWMFLNSHCLYEKWGWCVRCELSRWGNVCTKLQVYIGVVVRSNQPLYIVHFFKFLQSALIKVKLNNYCLLCTSFRSSRRGCMFVAGSNREGFHLKRQPLTLTIYIYMPEADRDSHLTQVCTCLHAFGITLALLRWLYQKLAMLGASQHPLMSIPSPP